MSEDFPGRLRQAFKGAGNKEIARKLGVTAAAVSNYFNGRTPDADKLRLIAELTNCNLHWLLTGDDPPLAVSENREQQSVDPLINREVLDKMIREIVRDELRDVGGEVGEIQPAEMILAPVVAHIGPGVPVAAAGAGAVDPKEEVRKMIGADEIEEIQRRIEPRRKRKTG